MQFISTRNSKNTVSFYQAVTECIPADGGMYVPAREENIRPWIYYMNEDTPFTSIAGALTSALLKEEVSPIISEAIASRAFPFTPQVRRLDEHLYALELFHGPTGSHKDFGVSYLASCLEHILHMKDKNAIVLAVTTGETGACIAQAFKGKKHLKAVLLYPGVLQSESGGSQSNPHACVRGLQPEDLWQNGGSVYPVEINGTLEDCYRVANEIYQDRDLVARYGLTQANTINIGRLLPQTFAYMYAFTRLKSHVYGDIYYAMSAGNYSMLVAGLYSWKFSLPVNGFVTNCTEPLGLDKEGKCGVTAVIPPALQVGSHDASKSSNLERLSEVFATQPSMLRGLVFPAPVGDADVTAAMRELYDSYSYAAHVETARAYAAAKKRHDQLCEDEGTVVLVSYYHPSLSAAALKDCCGAETEMPERIRALCNPLSGVKTADAERTAIINILHEIRE